MPAANFPPNGYGLYDMAGNAWQWVADWYRADYVAMQASLGKKPIADPQGPADAFDPSEPDVPANVPKRVIRGGSSLHSYVSSGLPAGQGCPAALASARLPRRSLISHFLLMQVEPSRPLRRCPRAARQQLTRREILYLPPPRLV